jgi:uncharacterized radical SAM superfamily Fe-S cluster-containing enzyme
MLSKGSFPFFHKYFYSCLIQKPFLKGILKFAKQYLEIFEEHIKSNYESLEYFDKEEEIKIPKVTKILELQATIESIQEYISKIKTNSQNRWAQTIYLPAAQFEKLQKAQMYYPIRISPEIQNFEKMVCSSCDEKNNKDLGTLVPR